MSVALCTRTDLYPRDDLYLHTSEKMIGGAYLFSLVLMNDMLLVCFSRYFEVELTELKRMKDKIGFLSICIHILRKL